MLDLGADDVEREHSDNEHDRENGGDAADLAVELLALFLAEEGVCAAGDRTGKTVRLALLQKHCGNDDNADDEKCDLKNECENVHGNAKPFPRGETPFFV